jgi:hypothetical protein
MNCDCIMSTLGSYWKVKMGTQMGRNKLHKEMCTGL